jgi:predicted ATP-grasp superfamily ATP-dependent carboligase
MSKTPVRVVIVGVSTRAAAESAARAGFAVTAIDGYADRDQHPSVRAIAVVGRFSVAAARLVRTIDADAVAYLSSFENHPRMVSAMAAGRALWGNAPAVLRRVRDPLIVARALERRGCAAPAVRTTSGSMGRLDRARSPQRRWLVKPLASGGGRGVREWTRGTRRAGGHYLQELVEGTPGSVVFVAAGGRAVPLAVTRQLVGEQAFGASGYQYCGNILASGHDHDASIMKGASALADAAAGAFGLVGVNGVDFVVSHGVVHPIEINPRWSASIELAERACGIGAFAAHADACVTGTLPSVDLARLTGAVAIGKAVVFARRTVTIGDTDSWLEEREEAGLPAIRDVPHAGTVMAAGRPVCTVFGSGIDVRSCYAALVRRAERVYARLAAWETGGAIE